VPRSKKVCSVLQNSHILLGGCRVLRYIRGRGLLREDPTRWVGIIKVWMFGALDMGLLMSQPRVRSYFTSQTSGTRANRSGLQLGMENMAVLWANDRKRSYPSLGFERGWVDECWCFLCSSESARNCQCNTSPGVFSRYRIYIYPREEGSLSCLRLIQRVTPKSTTRLYRGYVHSG
jgi:hypothetical protein